MKIKGYIQHIKRFRLIILVLDFLLLGHIMLLVEFIDCDLCIRVAEFPHL